MFVLIYLDAASDSYAGFILYHVLDEKRQSLDPTPPLPFNAELNESIRLADGAVIPVDPAADEAEEPEPDTKSVSTAPNRPKRPVEASDVQLEDEEVSISTSSKASSTIKSKPKTIIPSSQHYTDAEAWATSYRASHPVPPGAPSWSFVGPATLRAYALWQHNKLDIPTITTTLRDPPLKESTVTTYILEAIRVEKLPYDKDRLKAVFEILPPQTRENWRYRALWAYVKGSEAEKR